MVNSFLAPTWRTFGWQKKVMHTLGPSDMVWPVYHLHLFLWRWYHSYGYVTVISTDVVISLSYHLWWYVVISPFKDMTVISHLWLCMVISTNVVISRSYRLNVIWPSYHQRWSLWYHLTSPRWYHHHIAWRWYHRHIIKGDMTVKWPHLYLSPSHNHNCDITVIGKGGVG